MQCGVTSIILHQFLHPLEYVHYIHSFIHSFIRSFIRSFVRSFIRSSIHSFIHSFRLLLSSLWVSRTGSTSNWCALQEALYKSIDTIQYNRPTISMAPVQIHYYSEGLPTLLVAVVYGIV